MSQFRENLHTDGKMNRRTDTPYFLGPSWYQLAAPCLILGGPEQKLEFEGGAKFKVGRKSLY